MKIINLNKNTENIIELVEKIIYNHNNIKFCSCLRKGKFRKELRGKTVKVSLQIESITKEVFF